MLIVSLCSMEMKTEHAASDFFFFLRRSLSFTFTDPSMPLIVFAYYSKSSAQTAYDSYTFL